MHVARVAVLVSTEVHSSLVPLFEAVVSHVTLQVRACVLAVVFASGGRLGGAQVPGVSHVSQRKGTL